MMETAGWKVMKTQQGYAGLVARLEQAIAGNKMGLVTRASATVGAKQQLVCRHTLGPDPGLESGAATDRNR